MSASCESSSARLVTLMWIVAIGISLVACDAGFLTEAPSASCTEAGVQCRLETGPLGVCERTSCPPGAAPPCFACTPQH